MKPTQRLQGMFQPTPTGSAELPQYVFDPVTQKYTLVTPTQSAQNKSKSGLGSLYEAGGDGAMAPTGPGLSMMSPGMAEMGVGLQNIGQFANQMGPMAAFSPVTTALTGLAGMAGNAMMGSQVSPVANPSPMTVTSIAPDPAFSTPTQGLAAMNAQEAANQATVANQAAVASTAEATANAVADATADAADAAADAGGVGDGVGGGGDGGGDGGDGGGGSAGDGGDGDGGGGSAGDGGAAGSAGTGDGEREGGMIYQKRYAEGGLASAAQHVQSQGRGEDKVLVHMTPNEVRGLQAIAMQHGGSLTINPKTGLVEAGFLNSILPMVAGAALAPFTGGASMAALLVGGGTALMTGSLEKGLMAGLGAFGGASLAGSLSAASAASTAGQTMTPAAANAAAITPQAAAVTPQAVAGPAVSNVYPQEFMRGTAASFVDPTIATGAAPTTAQIAASPAGIARVTPITYENMGAGFKALGSEQGRNLFMEDIGGIKGLATKVVAPVAAGSMFSAEEPDTGGGKPQEYIRPYSFDFNRADTEPGFKYRTGEKGESTAEQRYFTPTFTGLGVYKAGTEPGPSFYGTPTAEQYALYSGPRTGNVESGALGLGLSPFNKEAVKSLSSGRFAAGGVAGLGKGGLKDGAFIVPADVVAHLGNGSNDAGQKILARGLGARPIKGKGDGMSDSIPTSIEGKQPARVADGEAYIPPEVVKKVGSKRLYAMMAKIRKARTNTTRQAPEVDPRKFMPA